MTVAQLLDTISCYELTEWYVHDKLEHEDYERERKKNA